MEFNSQESIKLDFYPSEEEQEEVMANINKIHFFKINLYTKKRYEKKIKYVSDSLSYRSSNPRRRHCFQAGKTRFHIFIKNVESDAEFSRLLEKVFEDIKLQPEYFAGIKVFIRVSFKFFMNVKTLQEIYDHILNSKGVIIPKMKLGKSWCKIEYVKGSIFLKPTIQEIQCEFKKLPYFYRKMLGVLKKANLKIIKKKWRDKIKDER